MRSLRNLSGGDRTPGVSPMGWNLLAIPAAILLVMAILQVISFSKFTDFLNGVNIGWSTAVAVVLIVAEVWGALSLLRIPMPALLRFWGVTMAVLVAGFWFIESLFFVTSDVAKGLGNSGFFGKYLSQSPGWWTVVEASIFLLWIVYAAEILKWRPEDR